MKIMEKYDVINVVGEGSYGLVMRCRHRDSGQYVAIKKFLETEDDPTVRKMAIREIRMLKKLRHENLVNMLEVFRRKKRYFLVFEYLEHTVLEELEARAGGLGFVTARKYIYQILRALNFIHSHNVIHRDVKPENVLVSRLGIIKLCDFGFARLYSENETFTDYVATRWYRSPELLVGDPRYGKEVDIWAIGCLYSEMMTGEPLFPGESDIDQLFQIVRVLGKLSQRHQVLITQNSLFNGMKQEQNTSLVEMFPDWNRDSLDFLIQCLKMDEIERPVTDILLKHDLFVRDDFVENFLPELRAKINSEAQSNPLSKRIGSLVGSGKKLNDERTKIRLSEIPNKIVNNINNNDSNSNNNDHNNNNNDNNTNSNDNSNIRERSSHISLISLNGHRSSFGNEEQIAPFRHYLTNSQIKPQAKQISINNLVFREDDKLSTSSSSRILSAKLQKTTFDKSQLLSQTQIEASSSPVHFQSLQPDIIISQLHQDNNNTNNSSVQGKRLSPVQNPASSSIGGHYFNQKKSNNILVLQQMAQQRTNKNFSINSQIPVVKNNNLIPKNTRNSNLLDINILPLALGNNSDISKDISPRILPPYPWLNVNQKYSSISNKMNITNRGLTDWRQIAREPNDFLLPNCPGPSTTTSPYKGNKKKLSPMSTHSFQDRILENSSFPPTITQRNSPSSDQENEL